MILIVCHKIYYVKSRVDIRKVSYYFLNASSGEKI